MFTTKKGLALWHYPLESRAVVASVPWLNAKRDQAASQYTFINVIRALSLPEPLTMMNPVHGSALLVIDERGQLYTREGQRTELVHEAYRSYTKIGCDILFTKCRDKPIGLAHADCCALVLVGTGWMMMVHVGRSGTLDKPESVAKTMWVALDFLDQEGINPASAEIALAPNICSVCYALDGGPPRDVYGDVASTLAVWGVIKHPPQICTVCSHPPVWYSHYKGDKDYRNLTLAMLK